MAKTIEIDDDAYSCLEHARNQGESWSDLIKRCVTPKRSLDDILHQLDVGISEETLTAIDESVERRRSAPRFSSRGLNGISHHAERIVDRLWRHKPEAQAKESTYYSAISNLPSLALQAYVRNAG